MKKIDFLNINKLIDNNKIDKAQSELAKFGSELLRNPDYLFLRSKIFYINRLYYLAIDTLLIALEFEQKNEIYFLLAKIYEILGNKELSSKLLDTNLRLAVVNSLKDELSGIYRKDTD